MSIVRFVFLLLTTLGLAGTAQAVPALGSLLLHPGVENYGRTSANGITGLYGLSGGTVGSTGELVYGPIAAPYFGVDCDDSLIRCFAMPRSDCFSAQENIMLQVEFGLNPVEDPLSKPSNDGNPSGVPEPDTMILLGSGLLVLAGIGRRFTRN